ncbi:MAG: UPF0147 family protein [Candidatus Geothermarchaeales archaeon]
MSKRKKKVKDEEHKKKILEVTAILQNISQTTIIPRNIRRTADSAIETLRNEDLTPGVRAANAVSILNGILHDPNMPSFARVKIWNVIGMLETIQD